MTIKPLMSCGCVATGTMGGKPVCVAHSHKPEGLTVVDIPPVLLGRYARCTCGKKVQSSLELPFFEYRGGILDECVECHYTEIAHERFSGRLMDVLNSGHWPMGVTPHKFEARKGAEFDRFYCGCAGWD